jgi:DNA modification methylase
MPLLAVGLGMDEWRNRVLTGDVRERLDDLPDDSVHMCMTSPPYFGLRDYGHEDQIGLEDELDAYIDELVDVFREVRRVLRADGSAWLNLGDSYAQTGSGQSEGSYKESIDAPEPRGDTFGRKNKMLVPHRVAIALQDDGWVVRNDVTWVKPNPMPSSVKDRLNTTTEQIFHLTPEPDYWYDLDAIREPHESDRTYRGGSIEENGNPRSRELDTADKFGSPADKNPGDVFEVTTKPFPDAHFAVYPPELCEKPIKATCPPTVCAECGAPYEREVEHEKIPLNELPKTNPNYRPNTYERYKGVGDDRNDSDEKRTLPSRETTGWTPTCDCDTDATEPGIALDPFAGAGTTLLKAKELGRRFVGVELNPEYADMARARIGLSPHEPAHVRADDAQQGFEAFTDGGHD